MGKKKALNRKKSRTLVMVAAVLTAFNLVVWHGVLANDAPAPSEVVATPAPAIAAVDAPAPWDGIEPAMPENVGTPARISIPSIAVEAAIEGVRLADDGSMGVPGRATDVGWYELGARPGEAGSAVVTGHLDGTNGQPAVFTDLRKVRTGDAIIVRDDRGTDIAFAVREIRKYDALADATDVFVSRDGKAHLNLITCDGVWDKRANRYSERLVLLADKVGD